MAKRRIRQNITSDQLVESVLADVMEYCHIAGIRHSTFGRLAVNDAYFVQRLTSRQVKLSTVARVQAFMREKPPRAGAA